MASTLLNVAHDAVAVALIVMQWRRQRGVDGTAIRVTASLAKPPLLLSLSLLQIELSAATAATRRMSDLFRIRRVCRRCCSRCLI